MLALADKFSFRAVGTDEPGELQVRIDLKSVSLAKHVDPEQAKGVGVGGKS
jgi:hypothetical protein